MTESVKTEETTKEKVAKIIEETKGTKDLFKFIDAGCAGKNIGIPTNSKKLDKIIYGTQKGFMYTVGADTGGGKTSYVLDCFVYNLLKNRKVGEINYPVRLIYYSFEMSEVVLLAKLMSRYLFDKYNKILTYKDILSLENTLSLEDKKYVDDSREWVNNISSILEIYDNPLTPEQINSTLYNWLEKFGTFSVINNKVNYEPKNPDLYLVAFIDHVGLIAKGSHRSLKDAIDSTVPYFIEYRSKCKLTSIMIQQLNRNAKSMDRKSNGFNKLQLDDFKETSSTADASEVVMALYYPFREQIVKCEGYKIKDCLEDNFRLMQVLKNRYGLSDIAFGMNFYGAIGLFRDMPLPTEIKSYEEYTDLNLYLQNKINETND